MRPRFVSVKVAAGEEGEGLLVFDGEWLVAVLVRLSRLHGAQAGWWYLEKGFGGFDVPEQPCFPTPEAAASWIRAHAADRPRARQGA